MHKIDEILHSKIKPTDKQIRLVEGIISGEIPVEKFMDYFVTARGVDKGACADAMKHISLKSPGLLAPYIDTLIRYVNYPLPRVRWGVPESIGNLAKDYPELVVNAIPSLLKNTTQDKTNGTVVRWCAAYALGEIAKNNPGTRADLVSIINDLIAKEQNNGVKNVYIKALKAINQQQVN